MSNIVLKVKVEALVSNTSCFIETFLAAVPQESGLCIVYFFFIIHFPQALCGSTDEKGCSQMVSMSSLIGSRLKFQTDHSPSQETEAFVKCQAAGQTEAIKKWRQDVNDSLFPQPEVCGVNVLVLFLYDSGPNLWSGWVLD